MRRCRSCCMSLPCFCPLLRRCYCVVATSMVSSSLISWIRGFWFPRQFPREEPHPLEVPGDPPKICQLRLNSRAFSTKVSSVVGCGESIRSLFCRAGGSARRKAHILVVSSTPVRLAWVLQSRNQVAKSLAPIKVPCIFAMASIWAAGGMNCFSKAALKSFHVP